MQGHVITYCIMNTADVHKKNQKNIWMFAFLGPFVGPEASHARRASGGNVYYIVQRFGSAMDQACQLASTAPCWETSPPDTPESEILTIFWALARPKIAQKKS